MDHLEAIVILKNIINPDFCKRVIALTDKKAKKNLTVNGGLDINYRNVKGYYLIQSNTPTDKFYWNFIKLEIEKFYTHYKIKFPHMASNKINQIDLLK